MPITSRLFEGQLYSSMNFSFQPKSELIEGRDIHFDHPVPGSMPGT